MSTTEDRTVIAPDLVWRLLDDSVVLVSPKSGEVRVLNAMGTTIWQLMVDKEPLTSIESHLVTNYDVTEQRAHEDLAAFVDELVDRGILISPDVVS